MNLLKNKAFGLFFICSMLSLFGEGMFNFLTAIFIVKETGQGAFLAQMMIITMIPSIIVSPFMGVIMDKSCLYKIGHISNLIKLLSLFTLAIRPELFNNLNTLYLLIGLYYLGWYISLPLFDTLLSRLLKGNEYKEGSSWAQMAWQIGLLGSIIITGHIMAKFGLIKTVHITLGVDAVGSIAFLYLHIKHPHLSINLSKREDTSQAFFKNIKEGALYLKERKKTLVIVAIQTMIWPIFQGMNILFIKMGLDLLKFDESQLGILGASCGLGSIVSVFLCIKFPKAFLLKILISSMLIVAVLFLFFLGEVSFISFLITYFLIGIFMGNTKIISKTLVFEQVENKYIGRAMNVINMGSLILAILITYILGISSDYNIQNSYIFLSLFILIGPLLLAQGMFKKSIT